ncbi:helix-turn-helix domain-containing protein [Cohnella caldifontis]|uniref:helix-turn-helix domain-containing protein n=1 Tax=Cohnella caldifontis TaxID=3027471 RepID=UPI0023EBEA7B|nr:helix-turn-helix domain-containing protein [Cohnella sp. YIM B05605]
MKPIRVMIVDDEILAIEHLRGLVPWDALGFEIVCAATNPLQAPELARKHQPELAIMDIVMPGMDGLALCERLAAAGSLLKIVLLTSYKEFDYAKAAVKLGVSNYWVKHEMNGETLQRELAGLRQEIERERQRRDADRGRLLTDWLGGRPLTDEQWAIAAGGKASAADNLQLIVLQPDLPFPVLAGIVGAADVSAARLPAEWPDGGDAELLAAVRFLDNQYVLLYTDGGIRGEGKKREFLEEKASKARETLERRIGTTASVAAAFGLAGRVDVPAKLAEAARFLALSVFAGPRASYRLNDPAAKPPTEVRPLAWVDGMARFREALNAGNFAEASNALEALFGQAEASRDVTGFADFCRQLAALLDRSRAASRLPSLREAWEAGNFRAEQWVSVAGIRSWALAEVDRLAEAAGGAAALSRKVRQALEYMESRYADEELSADAIAQHLGISRDYLRHVFKEETGRTLLDKLTDIRMERAKALLEQGTFKVYEIAERVGYRNGRYFSQVFRKWTGQNPLDFMERKR